MTVHAGRVGELHRDSAEGRPVLGARPDAATDAQRDTPRVDGGVPRSRRRDEPRPVAQSDLAPGHGCVLAARAPAHAQAALQPAGRHRTSGVPLVNAPVRP